MTYQFSEQHFVAYLKELEVDCSEYDITADEMAECYLDYIAVEFYDVEIIPMIPAHEDASADPSKTSMFDIGDPSISKANQIASLKNQLALAKFRSEFQSALIEYQKSQLNKTKRRLGFLKLQTELLIRLNLIKIFVYDVLGVQYSVSPEFEKIRDERANNKLLKQFK